MNTDEKPLRNSNHLFSLEDDARSLPDTPRPNKTTDEIEDSPVEQVRLTVPTTDDPSLPTLTFRTWVLGPIVCITTGSIFQYYYYQQNKINITESCVLLFYLVMGKLMAATLPTRTWRIPVIGFEFSMNPGPFNLKEHVLMYTLGTQSFEALMAMPVLNVVKAYYHRNIGFWPSYILVITSHLLGYGFAGMFMKFLVYSPYMWYPLVLPLVPFYRAIHNSEKRSKGRLSKTQFMAISMVAGGAFYIIPGYFFKSLTAISFVCLIWKDSVTAQQIGSGMHGLGLGSFAFDWVTISGWVGNPIAFPKATILNKFVGFIAIVYIVVPLAYWTNTYNAKKFAINEVSLYDDKGLKYNTSRVFPDGLIFNQKEYHNYSKIYMSIFNVFSIGFNFAAVTAALAHFALFYGRDTWGYLKKALKNKENFNDVHNVLMRQYDSIPQWWFYILIVLTGGVSLLNCYINVGDIQLPPWGLLLACALGIVLILPVGILRATTGVGVKLYTISEIIIGYAYPGRPVANMAFASYGTNALSHALNFFEEFKLCHYMKIPPKDMFVVQIVGSFLASSSRFFTGWWVLTTVKDVCDEEKLPTGSPWTCPSAKRDFSRSIIWGGAGPSQVFSPSEYGNMYYFFLLGAVAPVIIWGLSCLYPRQRWIRLINLPVIFGVAANMPPIRPIHYWSFLIVGFIFNFWVYSRHKGWWSRYAYDLSNGLDLGAGITSLILSYALDIKDIYGPEWWGLEMDDHCPLAQCPTASGVKVKGCPVF